MSFLPSHAHSETGLPVPGLSGPRRWQAPAFAGSIDCVLVEPPVTFDFAGSVAVGTAQAIWTWMLRDLGEGLVQYDLVRGTGLDKPAFDAVLPALIVRVKAAQESAGASAEAQRRLRAQIGQDDAIERLPVVLNALRNRNLLVKAQAFGKATNTLSEDTGLAGALQAMPLGDPATAALLMHAAVGQVANPTRLITAAIRISGGTSEAAIRRHQLAPLIDAILAHAQNQLHAIQGGGAFADIDLSCRALERFHRLARAVTGNVELERGGRWGQVLSGLTKSVSERIEPRLRDVLPDINGSLRQWREGGDRLDADLLLAALSGIYLLATLRDCKDSLALNALFEQVWAQSGEALELHMKRNLELLRQAPHDPVLEARLDTGIKMAEVRFNADYAETLRRARATASRT